MNIDNIQEKIKNHRDRLLEHKLYSNIETIKDLQLFTENHIYAVWDFMSLLKALQIRLTCTKTPWLPNKNSQTAYLINEIVLAEETDINQAGERKSHYELYLDAMIDIGAKPEKPVEIINKIANSEDIFNAIENLKIHENIKEFLNFTFSSKSACVPINIFMLPLSILFKIFVRSDFFVDPVKIPISIFSGSHMDLILL